MGEYAHSKRQIVARRWRRVVLVALPITALFAFALLLPGNEFISEINPGNSEKAVLEAGSSRPDESPSMANDPPVERLSAPQVAGDSTAGVSPDDIVAQVTRLLDKSAAPDSRQLPAMIEISGNPVLPLQDRIVAIYWLARLASDEAIEALEGLLASDTDPVIRDSVAMALGESGNPAATVILLELLTDADREVVLSAIEGLASRHDPAIRRILLDLIVDEQQADEVRSAAAAALGEQDDVANDLLLAFEGSQGALAAGVLQGLAQQGFVHSEPVFRKLMADSNTPFELKLEAIGALAEGSPEAAELLLELARDDADPELRSAAIDALAFADESASRHEAFAELALGESSAEVRASLYNTLSLYADQASAEPAATKLVINTLAETEPRTRLEGYRMVASMLNYEHQSTIATTFDNSMVPWLQRSAEFGDDKYTRFISIDALRLANTPGSRQALGELRYSANPAVAQAAQQALRLAEQSAGGGELP